MDRKIEHKGLIRKKHIPWMVGGALALIFVSWLILGDHRQTLRVDKESIVIATVTEGEFADYVRVSGTVEPITTVQLTPLESGIVEERFIEEGSMVRRGDVIVRLSNPQLNIQILESEASLAEKENFLRNTRVEMEQEKLNLARERLQLEIELERKKRKFEQNKALYADKLIAKEEYLMAEEDYRLAMRTVELVIVRQEQDSIYRSTQVDNMELNLLSMQRNMALVRQRVENLNVKSTIDGELGMLDVVLGQSLSSGHNMGQINDLSDFKIEAQIDEHYIDRVTRGLVASFERGNQSFEVSVSKVFPDVREGKFRTWLTFNGERPENIRTGQTYYLNLQLGNPTQSIIIPRGAFFQSTGGNWIYVLEGDKAVRRPITINRQNPAQYEVTSGLKAGDRVIVSGYDTYGDSETLTLN